MESDKQLSPWELVYRLYNGKYTKEQVDDMTFIEVVELIDMYYDYENQ
jgi:hypothetical protein